MGGLPLPFSAQFCGYTGGQLDTPTLHQRTSCIQRTPKQFDWQRGLATLIPQHSPRLRLSGCSVVYLGRGVLRSYALRAFMYHRGSKFDPPDFFPLSCFSCRRDDRIKIQAFWTSSAPSVRHVYCHGSLPEDDTTRLSGREFLPGMRTQKDIRRKPR